MTASRNPSDARRRPGPSAARPGTAWARAIGGSLALLGLLAFPAAVSAHQLSGTYESRLPLVAYLAGAGATVALSFLFVLARDLRAQAAPDDGRRRVLPAWIALPLRAVGLLGWAWIMAQGIVGGSSAAEVAHLFLWVYGWVGLAMVSAFVGPVWTWLNPFDTLHRIGARLLAAAGIRGLQPAPYPAALGHWPAAAGFAVFVWLELVVGGGDSGTLFAVLLAYTAFTLAMMAQYGREPWLEHGETFSVWFGLLGRVAPWAPDRTPPVAPGGESAAKSWTASGSPRLRRRGYGAGLLEPGLGRADVVLVSLGTGSILFDGLSQTQIWFDAFGAPGTLPQTALLAGFLAIIAGAAFLAVRAVGVAATSAGLIPIAVGYLVAHYLTFLLIDGQRIVIALADPFQQGWSLLPTAFWEPTGDWLPPGLVWTIQLAAVVSGHMLGAWGGHVVAAAEGVSSGPGGPSGQRDPRLREIPLAIVMVGLTTLTLWSLGQAIVTTLPD